MTAPSTEASRTADAVRESPYVGLTAYAEDDYSFFFGRDRDIGVVRGNLQGARLTLFYGESGVGKSSVLLAGVVGRMRAEVAENALVLDEELDGEAPFAVAVFRSWVDPPVEPLMEAIRTAASAALGGRELEPWSPETSPIETLREWTRNIRTIYVVLDQFEEYFLYSEKDSGPVTFADTFPRIVNDVAVPVHFIISMREDALAKLDRFKDELPIYSNALRLDYLDEAAARKAIEGPLDRYTELYGNGRRFSADPELVDEVIRQIRIGRTHIGDSGTAQVEATDGRPGPIGTPLLQLVLTRLWEEERSLGSHVLRLETLRDRLKGTEEIVRTQLDRTLEDLTDDERRLAARSFRYLVTPSGSKIAHFAEDLAKYIGAPEDELRGVLAKLDKASIVRTIEPPPDQKGASSRYEIAHDVLGPAVVEWATREQHELELREHAEEEAQRQRTQFARRLATVLTISTAAAVVLATVAFLARNEAASERDSAQANARAARANALAAEAIRLLSSKPREGLRTAIRASEQAETSATRSALRVALAQPQVAARDLHEEGVTSARFSDDGRLVVTASDDGTARLWNARTRTRLHEFDHETPINSVAVSRDGRLVATAGQDGSARLWDARSGDSIRMVRHRGGAVNDVAFSRDGRLLATAGEDGTARIWNVRDGAAVGTPLRHPGPVNGVAFGRPDGRVIATASDDKTARLWDLRSGDVRELAGHRDVVNSVAFSRDGSLLVTASKDTTARVWEVGSGEEKGAPLTHPREVNSARFAYEGPLVVTASDDGAARLWALDAGEDLGAGAMVAALVGHTGPVQAAAFSPDGTLVVTASADRTARVWASEANPSLVGIRHPSGVTSVAFSPDGKTLATAAGTEARLSSVSTRESPQLLDHDDVVSDVAFRRDGRRIVTASGNTASMWDVRTGDPIGEPLVHRGRVSAATFSPDGQRIATASLDGTTWLWDARSGDRIDVVGGPASVVNDVAFHPPDGQEVAIASGDGTARLWNVRSGRVRVFGRPGGILNAVAFSPDGRLLATVGLDQTFEPQARLWDVRTGRTVEVLRGHSDLVSNVAFSPDGSLVLTSSADHTARLWDVRTGTSVAVLQRHGEVLTSAAFNPRGSRVATGSTEGTARIYACGICGSYDALLARARVLVSPTRERR